MKSKVLRIIKYAEVHEDVRSHRLKSLKYVQMPVGRESDGWEALGVLTGGLEAKGAYLELVEFAASCPVRGLLASEDKPFGKAILARRCRMTIEQLEAALGLLMHEEVGFIDYLDWPVDPRLIDKHEHQGRPAGQTITSHSIDADDQLITHDGHPAGESHTQNCDESTRASDEYTKNDSDSVYERTQNNRKSTQKPPGNCISAHNRKRKTGNGNGKGLNINLPETERGKVEGQTGEDFQGKDFSGSSDSASGCVHSRSAGRQHLLLAVAPIFAPTATQQHQSDRTTCDRVFDDMWPDDLDDRAGSERLAVAIELSEAARRRKRPMPWWVAAMRQRINGDRPWSKSAKAGAA